MNLVNYMQSKSNNSIVIKKYPLKSQAHRRSDVDKVYHKFSVTYVMRGFRRDAGGPELSHAKLRHHRAPSLTHKRNAIEMAFRWRAIGGPLRIMIPLYPL